MLSVVSSVVEILGRTTVTQEVVAVSVLDEQVRRALDSGCDRQAVMDVFELSRRSTFNKEKRAYAYDFPLDAFSRGGRPTEEARGQATGSSEDDLEDDDGQQRLAEVADGAGGAPGTADAANVAVGEDNEPNTSRADREAGRAVPGADEAAELQARLQQAIESLQALDSAL